MKTPNLVEVQQSEVIDCIDIKDLVLAGLSLNEDSEINENFCYRQKIGNDAIFDLCIIRSPGWYGNLEFNFGFFLEPSESGENVHIGQEVLVFEDTDGQFYFTCPILGNEKVCQKLYLRNDFPLFASDEALKVR